MGCSGSKAANADEANPIGQAERLPKTSDPAPKLALESAQSSQAEANTIEKVRESKALVLSEEERNMNGAPEGELFVAEVLLREQIEASPYEGLPPREMLETTVIPALTAKTSKPWNIEFDALTTLRRILVHHSSIISSTDLEILVPAIVKAIRNSRSTLAKNAIFSVSDLFLKCAQVLSELSQDAIDALCFALLDSTASNVAKSLRTAAAEALNQAVATGGALALVASAVSIRADHKNAEVSANSMIFCEKALAGLRSENAEFAKDITLDRLVPALSVGINAKSPSGKKAAKACCVLLSSSMGSSSYEDVVSGSKSLSTTQMDDLKSAGKAPAKKDNSSGASAKKTVDEARKAKLKELKAKAKK